MQRIPPAPLKNQLSAGQEEQGSQGRVLEIYFSDSVFSVLPCLCGRFWVLDPPITRDYQITRCFLVSHGCLCVEPGAVSHLREGRCWKLPVITFFAVLRDIKTLNLMVFRHA